MGAAKQLRDASRTKKSCTCTCCRWMTLAHGRRRALHLKPSSWKRLKRSRASRRSKHKRSRTLNFESDFTDCGPPLSVSSPGSLEPGWWVLELLTSYESVHIC